MQIKLSVEFLAVAAPITLLIIWAVWYYLTLWYAKRKYSLDNDKGRNYKRAEGGANPSIAKRSVSIERVDTIAERGNIQAAVADRIEPDKNSNGEASTGNGKVSNPFRRTKK